MYGETLHCNFVTFYRIIDTITNIILNLYSSTFGIIQNRDTYIKCRLENESKPGGPRGRVASGEER